jgi:ornithine--oxo-acid transaminase
VATLHVLDDEGLVERSARLGEMLLSLTRPLLERHEVVRDVRGLGLMWAIEFGEPRHRGRSYRLVERMQPGLFAQLVVAPLFSDYRVLSQVAGHHMPVIKGLPPLTVTEDDLAYFAEALDETVTRARHLPRSLASFALTAAGVR